MSTVVESRGHRQIPIVCPGHTRPLAEVQFCAIPEESNRTFLISACHDKLPMVRDATSGDWIGTFRGHKGAVWSCRLDPAGYLAATASGDFSVKVWDAITGKDLTTFGHRHIVKTCEFSPDSKFLATGGHEGILRIYNLVNVFENKNDEEVQPLCIPQLKNEKLIITKCLWKDAKTVIASGSDGTIRFWNIAQTPPTLSHTLSVDASVRDMELKELQDGRTLLTIAAGSKVSFFDVTKDDQSSYPLIHSYTVPIHFREVNHSIILLYFIEFYCILLNFIKFDSLFFTYSCLLQSLLSFYCRKEEHHCILLVRNLSLEGVIYGYECLTLTRGRN